jgi:hypothetical protein
VTVDEQRVHLATTRHAFTCGRGDSAASGVGSRSGGEGRGSCIIGDGGGGVDSRMEGDGGVGSRMTYSGGGVTYDGGVVSVGLCSMDETVGSSFQVRHPVALTNVQVIDLDFVVAVVFEREIPHAGETKV